MKELYKVAATSVGGRNGHVSTEDGMIDMDMRPPTQMGGPGGAANPEALFAAGYAACFNGALNHVARMKRIRVGETKVTVQITLGTIDDGNFQLAAAIDVLIPGVDEQTARELGHEAHQVCPYSRATRGNIEATVNVRTE